MRVCVITQVTCNDSSHLSWLESLVDSSQHAVESESSQSHFTGDSSQVKSFRWNIESSQVKSSQKLWLESESVTCQTCYNTDIHQHTLTNTRDATGSIPNFLKTSCEGAKRPRGGGCGSFFVFQCGIACMFWCILQRVFSHISHIFHIYIKKNKTKLPSFWKNPEISLQYAPNWLSLWGHGLQSPLVKPQAWALSTWQQHSSKVILVASWWLQVCLLGRNRMKQYPSSPGGRAPGGSCKESTAQS